MYPGTRSHRQLKGLPASDPRISNWQSAVTFLEEVRQVSDEVSCAAVVVPVERTLAYVVLAAALGFMGGANFIALRFGLVPAFYEAAVTGVAAIGLAFLCYRRQLRFEESYFVVQGALQRKTYTYVDLESVDWLIVERHGVVYISPFVIFQLRDGRYFAIELSPLTAKVVAYAASRVIAAGGDTKSWLPTPPGSADLDW